jgi:mono/diheme cytochrome c family protein
MIRNVLLAILLPSTAFAAGNGASLYKQSCVACHAADGSGSTPAGKALKARDLRSAEVQKHSDAELTAAIRDGKGKMPPFKAKVSAADISALVAHIRALK